VHTNDAAKRADTLRPEEVMGRTRGAPAHVFVNEYTRSHDVGPVQGDPDNFNTKKNCSGEGSKSGPSRRIRGRSGQCLSLERNKWRRWSRG
jgi:hypothetical protein